MNTICDYKYAVIGYAYGKSATVLGSSQGPQVLRKRNLIKRLRALGPEVVDLGNVTAKTSKKAKAAIEEAQSPLEKQIKNFSLAYTATQRLAEKTTEALLAGVVPIVIGGDHSLSVGSVAAISNFYAKQGKDIGLLWIDSHADINTPDTSPSGKLFGMSAAVLLGLVPSQLNSLQMHKPAIKPDNLAYIGLRAVDEGERKTIKQHNIAAYTISEVDILGIAQVIREAIEIAGKNTAGFVVSLDLDVLDPRLAPGTGTPVHGGLTFREAHLALELLCASKQILGMELMELNPSLDKDFVTADLAISLLETAVGKTIL